MSQQAGSDGDGAEKTVEVRARTVDEAVARGLVRLGGLSRSEVEIEVISEGRSGLLGFGSEEAVVRLRVLAPGAAAPTRAEPPAAVDQEQKKAAPARRQRKAAAVEPSTGEPAGPALAQAQPASVAPDSDAIRMAEDVTRLYLGFLGYDDVTFEQGAPLVPVDVEEEHSLVLNLRGAETSRLLVRDGRPLLALQFLVRLAVNRQSGQWVNLLLDVDGDRARRVKELFALAEQSAELVDRDGRPVSLPPMTAYERRIVHLALRDHPSVTTQSIGRGETRKVTVRLKGQELTGV
jgi:spoIIIJ-associated protein